MNDEVYEQWIILRMRVATDYLYNEYIIKYVKNNCYYMMTALDARLLYRNQLINSMKWLTGGATS